jgi:glutamine amidotransferase
VLEGNVSRLLGPKVPHIGWSPCAVNKPNALLTSGWAYYAHSYAAPANSRGCVAFSRCGADFAAACVVDRIAGVQFHPEKSGDYGALFLRRWLEASDAV